MVAEIGPLSLLLRIIVRVTASAILAILRSVPVED